MGLFICSMLSFRGRAYLHQTGGRGQCVLPRKNNNADMEKKTCDNLYIARLTSNAMFYRICSDKIGKIHIQRLFL